MLCSEGVSMHVSSYMSLVKQEGVVEGEGGDSGEERNEISRVATSLHARRVIVARPCYFGLISEPEVDEWI